MFSCSACFRRAINGLLHESLPSDARSLPSVGRTRNTSQSIARHSTVQSIRKGHHQRVLAQTLREGVKIEPNRRVLTKGPSKVDRRDLLARERNRHHLDLESEGASAEGRWSSQGSSRRSEEHQMQFLKDPLKLATAVLDRLRIGDVESGRTLIRLSDKEKVENVVSWNHLMDYEISTGNMKAALKTYNEVGTWSSQSPWLPIADH